MPEVKNGLKLWIEQPRSGGRFSINQKVDQRALTVLLTALEASHADRRLLEQLHALALLIIQLAGPVRISFIVIAITDNAVSNQVVPIRVDQRSCLLQVSFCSLLLCPFVADLLIEQLWRLFFALVRLVIKLFTVGHRGVASFIL